MIKWTVFRIKVLLFSLLSLFLMGIFMTIMYNVMFKTLGVCTVISHDVLQRNITTLVENKAEWQVTLSWLHQDNIWVINYGWKNNYNEILSFLQSYPINYNGECIIYKEKLYLYSSVKSIVIGNFMGMNLSMIIALFIINVCGMLLIGWMEKCCTETKTVNNDNQDNESSESGNTDNEGSYNQDNESSDTDNEGSYNYDLPNLEKSNDNIGPDNVDPNDTITNV
jgi:hypothetical protein